MPHPASAMPTGEAHAGLPQGRLSHASVYATLAGLALIAAPWVPPATLTSLCCLAIAITGFPHGALDIDVLCADDGARRGGLIALYLGQLGLGLLLWIWQPAAALAAFFVASVLHFSEDWQAQANHQIFALGTALASLALPALTHGAVVNDLLIAVTGSPSAAMVTTALALMAPVALCAALCGLWCDLRAGRQDRALGGLLTLTLMALVPPLLAFTLYFCLWHSPKHLAMAYTACGRINHRRRLGTVALVSLAALGIMAGVFAAAVGIGLAPGLLSATFVTLSVLTLPHMLTPRLQAMWG